MNCKKCGAELDKDDTFCPFCGEYCNVSESSPVSVHREGSSVYEKPDTTLWIILGVVSAIFCCLIGGIGTTIYAAKASGNLSAGNIAQANENIEKAKKWFLATVIIGVISSVIALIAGI